MLAHEITPLCLQKVVFFKYGCLMIPVIKSWGTDTKKVVGAFIIGDMESKKLTQSKKENLVHELRMQKSSNMGVMKDLVQQIANFYNITYEEVVTSKIYSLYKIMRNTSKLTANIRPGTKNNAHDARCAEGTPSQPK